MSIATMPMEPAPPYTVAKDGLRRCPARRGSSVLLVVAVATILFATSSVFGGLSSARAAGTLPNGYTVNVSQTTDLLNDQTVAVTVDAADPSTFPVGEVELDLCRPESAGFYSSFRVVQAGSNCGYSPGDTALLSPRDTSTQNFYGDVSGSQSLPDDFNIGTGPATVEGKTLNCDSTDPCDLVVSIFPNQTAFGNEDAAAIDTVTLTYASTTNAPGCSGTSPDVISTVG
jgi:hypothetical protein